MSARDNPKLREIVERHSDQVVSAVTSEAGIACEVAYAVLDEVLGPLRECFADALDDDDLTRLGKRCRELLA